MTKRLARVRRWLLVPACYFVLIGAFMVITGSGDWRPRWLAAGLLFVLYSVLPEEAK